MIDKRLTAGLVATPTTPPNKALYASWGDQADTAISQGWRPETSDGNMTVFKSPYAAAFNNVVIPNQQGRGNIALIGHNNKTFDVVIRDGKGTVLNYVHKGITPAQVQQYITNANSTVAQRNKSVIAGTNPDRMINGTYVAIK